jgi:hypothetical protein
VLQEKAQFEMELLVQLKYNLSCVSVDGRTWSGDLFHLTPRSEGVLRDE